MICLCFLKAVGIVEQSLQTFVGVILKRIESVILAVHATKGGCPELCSGLFAELLFEKTCKGLGVLL